MSTTETPIFPMKRNLDCVYVRVKRPDGFKDLCFTDLTLEEQDDFLKTFEKDQLIRMCHLLANQLRIMGDQLDLYGE